MQGPTGNWLDPCCFMDDDGQAYLYWGANGPPYVAKLKDNMVELAETPRLVNYGNSNFFEAVHVHKRNGVYYFSYHGGGGHYSMGSSPYGPFTYKGQVNPSQSQDHHSHL